VVCGCSRQVSLQFVASPEPFTLASAFILQRWTDLGDANVSPVGAFPLSNAWQSWSSSTTSTIVASKTFTAAKLTSYLWTATRCFTLCWLPHLHLRIRNACFWQVARDPGKMDRHMIWGHSEKARAVAGWLAGPTALGQSASVGHAFVGLVTCDPPCRRGDRSDSDAMQCHARQRCPSHSTLKWLGDMFCSSSSHRGTRDSSSYVILAYPKLLTEAWPAHSIAKFTGAPYARFHAHLVRIFS
jgi:hypothetical protein